MNTQFKINSCTAKDCLMVLSSGQAVPQDIKAAIVQRAQKFISSLEPTNWRVRSWQKVLAVAQGAIAPPLTLAPYGATYTAATAPVKKSRKAAAPKGEDKLDAIMGLLQSMNNRISAIEAAQNSDGPTF